MSTLSSMRKVDAYLSGKAKAFDGSSMVYKEPDGTFTLERDRMPPISLGGPFPMAKRVIDQMRRTVGASNVSREPEARFSVAPAMTPEEWRDVRVGEVVALPFKELHYYDATDCATGVAMLNDRLPDDDLRKITHERIQAMRDCAEQLGLQGYDDHGLQRFADALASYLATTDETEDSNA